MKKALSAVLSLFVLLAALAVPTGSFAESIEIVKIGTALPLTVGFGVDTKKALEMLVDNFNGAGGITLKGKTYKFQLIVYDDKYKAEEGRAAVERLIFQDKVKHLLSIITASTMTSTLPLIEQEKILNITAASTPKILDPKLRYSFGTTVSRTTIPGVWSIAKRVFPNAKTALLITAADEGGKARAAEEKQVAEAFGIKVLDVLTYQREQVDFTSLAAKAMSYNADLIDYPTGAGTQFGLILKAVHAVGFKGGQIQASNPNLDEIATVASQEAVEGLLAKLADTDLADPPPPAKAFKEAITKRYGKWSPGSIPWIPAWFAFVEAIRKAQSLDPTVLADYISTKGLEFQRPDAKSRMVRRPDFGNNRYVDAVADVTYGQVRKGKLVPVGKLSISEMITANERVFGGGSWK